MTGDWQYRPRPLLYRWRSVHLLDGGSGTGGGRGSTRGSTRHTTTWCTTSSSSIQLLDDWVEDLLQLFLFVLVFILLCSLVVIQPLDALITLVSDGCLLRIRDSRLDLLFVHGRLHVKTIRLQTVLCLNLLSLFVIFSFVFFCVIDHVLNVLLRQSALVIGDSDLILLSCRLISS